MKKIKEINLGIYLSKKAKKGEIRIISADIALCEGKQNDNSVYSLFRLLPDKETYKRQVVHIESYNGANSDQQALRLKQLFYDFEADKLILDATGIFTMPLI